MSSRLTSWKEIAQYLGKGVRTVQRWEREFGLPVRRPGGSHRGIVFAHAEELDSWTKRQHEEQSGNLLDQLEGLRSALAEMVAENQALRMETESALRGRSRVSRSTQDLAERSAKLIQDTKAAALMYAETIEMSKNLRFIRRGMK